MDTPEQASRGGMIALVVSIVGILMLLGWIFHVPW